MSGMERLYVYENPLLACGALAPVWSRAKTKDGAGAGFTLRSQRLGVLLERPEETEKVLPENSKEAEKHKVPTASSTLNIYYYLLAQAELREDASWGTRNTAYRILNDLASPKTKSPNGTSGSDKLEGVLNHLLRARITVPHPGGGPTEGNPVTFGPILLSVDKGAGGTSVQIAPGVLRDGSSGGAARIDVELLHRLENPLHKAGYRLVVGLRALGVRQVECYEFTERAGSTAKDLRPSDVEKQFRALWTTLVAYGYLMNIPAPKKGRDGQYYFHFDWGTPVELPAGVDDLFHNLLAEGVGRIRAAEMLREDAPRAKRVVDAYRCGALGKANNGGGFIFSAWKDGWDIEAAIDRFKADASERDARASGQPSQAVAESGSDTGSGGTEQFDPGHPQHWEELESRDAGLEGFKRAVKAVLKARGERDPKQLYRHGDLLKQTYDVLGWKDAIKLLMHVYGMGEKDRPTSYLASIFTKEMNKARPAESRARGTRGTPELTLIKDIPNGSWGMVLLEKPQVEAVHSAISEVGQDLQKPRAVPPAETVTDGDTSETGERVSPEVELRPVELTLADLQRYIAELVDPRLRGASHLPIVARTAKRVTDQAAKEYPGHVEVEKLRDTLLEHIEHILGDSQGSAAA